MLPLFFPPRISFAPNAPAAQLSSCATFHAICHTPPRFTRFVTHHLVSHDLSHTTSFFTRFVTHHLVSRDLSHAASLQAPAAGLSTQTIAIIAGCSCGGVLLIAAAAYMIRRRRLALQPSTTAPSPASAPAMEMAPVHQLPVEAWKQQQQQQQQQHDHVSHVPHVLQQA